MTQKELLNKTFSEDLSLINERISKSKYPNTFKFLFRFDKKVELLFNILSETVKQNNFYASQAITRIVFEHFIVAYYVWTKARTEENDECATEYYSFYALQEQIKQENYNSKLDKSFDSSKTPLQNAAAKDPEVFGDITEDEILDLNKRANKFDIRRILSYLTDELDVTDSFKSLYVFVLDFCKRYNYLSTYIHGGPTAEYQAFENMPKTDYEKVLKDNLEYTEIMGNQLKSLILLLLVLDNKVNMDIYQPIYEFLEKNKHSK